jgi:hypothetical protein
MSHGLGNAARVAQRQDPRRAHAGARRWSSSGLYGKTAIVASPSATIDLRLRQRRAPVDPPAGASRYGFIGSSGSPATMRQIPTRRTASCVAETLVRANDPEREHRPAVVSAIDAARKEG